MFFVHLLKSIFCKFETLFGKINPKEINKNLF